MTQIKKKRRSDCTHHTHQFNVVYNNIFHYGYGYFCVFCLEEFDPYDEVLH